MPARNLTDSTMLILMSLTLRLKIEPRLNCTTATYCTEAKPHWCFLNPIPCTQKKVPK